MAFTNVWDDTQPPDTQLANLLGSDLRQMRVDVQQRMAAISGLDAAKPAFEAGFAGVLFFATDTGIVYQWSGAVWAQVSLGTTDYNNLTPVTLNGVTGNGVVLNMPANAIQVGSYYEVRMGIQNPGVIGNPCTVVFSVGNANGDFSISLTNGGAAVFQAFVTVQAAGLSVAYGVITRSDAANSGAVALLTTGAVTPFAGFTIKSSCSAGNARSLVFDYVCVRVKK